MGVFAIETLVSELRIIKTIFGRFYGFEPRKKCFPGIGFWRILNMLFSTLFWTFWCKKHLCCNFVWVKSYLDWTISAASGRSLEFRKEKKLNEREVSKKREHEETNKGCLGVLYYLSSIECVEKMFCLLLRLSQFEYYVNGKKQTWKK